MRIRSILILSFGTLLSAAAAVIATGGAEAQQPSVKAARPGSFDEVVEQTNAGVHAAAGRRHEHC